MKNNITLLGVLVTILALLVGAFGGLYLGASNNEEVKVPTAEEIAAKISVPAAIVVDNANLSNKVEALDAKISSLDEFEDEADEQLQNDTAKALVLKEISTRAFKEKVLALLNDEEGYSIDNYKNISVYYTKIGDVDLGDETAEVEVTIKVASFNDGDEDDSFKVKLTGNFLVEGLDVDDIEDAEVADDYELGFVMEYD